MNSQTPRTHARPRRALIASGEGRYSDPWHPYEKTSLAVAEILEQSRWHVDIDPDVDRALTRLTGYDLLIVNAGDPWRSNEASTGGDPNARAGLDDALLRGIGVVALHSSLSSLRDYPSFRRVVGGEWSPGNSWHPPLGMLQIHRAEIGDPRLIEDSEFTITDEAYADLIVDSDVRVQAMYSRDGVEHPVIWTKDAAPHRSGRSAVSALGHDSRAYESESYRRLLGRLADWVCADR